MLALGVFSRDMAGSLHGPNLRSNFLLLECQHEVKMAHRVFFW